jgi:hypothetical protein
VNRDDLWIVLENDRENSVVFWAVIDRVQRVVLGQGLSNQTDTAAEHAEQLVNKLVGGAE